MSTPASIDEAAPSLASEPKLIPVLGSRWALGAQHLLIALGFGVLFACLSHMPLRGTDLWGHVLWGRQMIETRTLPAADVLQPLADGMRVVDTAWLSQVVYSLLEMWHGPEALSYTFTIVVWLTYVLLARTCYLLTKHAGTAALATGLAVAVGWNRLTTIRPENFAVLLFVCLLWLLVARRVRRQDSVLADDRRGDWKMWVGVPVIFMLWANLHGSFLCGIAVLACFWIGRLIEAVWERGSLTAMFTDREARRLLYWTELAAAATLLNPYTIDAWFEALRFSTNANLQDILEWKPLALLGIGGIEFGLGLVLLAVALRHSRRSMSPTDVLLLAVFGVAAVLQLRMTGWFAVVWAIALAPHLSDALLRLLGGRGRAAAEAVVDLGDESADDETVQPLPAGRSFRYTLGCVAAVWIAFAFSTFSRPILGGSVRQPEAIYGPQSPMKLSAWLNQNKVSGQVYNPQYWGDWLAWAGPKSMKLFATTNVHLVPRSVWLDYRRIGEAQTGWDTTMDRYHVDWAIVDKTEQPALVRALKASPEWTQAYEDETALVFEHRSQRQPSSFKAGASSTEIRPAIAKPNDD